MSISLPYLVRYRILAFRTLNTWMSCSVFLTRVGGQYYYQEGEESEGDGQEHLEIVCYRVTGLSYQFENLFIYKNSRLS